MQLLVTAGNTQVPIDSVRCLTNIFSGRTGARIAREAWQRGHTVRFLTSHPEVMRDLFPDLVESKERWHVEKYRTYDDLADSMERHLVDEATDAIVHCAAVSDYLSAGVYAPSEGTRFDDNTLSWSSIEGTPRLEDRLAGKVKSSEPELWLRLVKAPKLVDRIRTDWKFQGVVVKFKLEVGLADDKLLALAEQSRLDSDADLMVANTLEGAREYAYIGSGANGYERVQRNDLAPRLIDVLELHQRGPTDG